MPEPERASGTVVEHDRNRADFHRSNTGDATRASGKKKAPAPAATGARADHQRLGSNRFTPLYVNPFGGANAIASAATIIATEARRRQDCFARTAKKFG